MSDTNDKELVAGHPPAVKAGGSRHGQHHKSSESDKVAPSEIKKEEEEFGSDPKPDRNAEIILSGALGKGDKDFAPEAVKHFHDKPLPCKEKKPIQQIHNIQQPR